ncbi:YicC/YloC family endoribonuclease [Roseicyclus marinus]|uniref:YicC/YloC family endoribonuclease n=1 Tax=Roseicyclus marinus TaxID=2161673 RepID=UPI00240F587E|nr:YicC/YloC family endoribonuclease [Roseicyclus marinus]MDG3040134.1 YicC family protein [Roseicyclus marinus]
MTGFAAREGADGTGASWSWELRSVNGRGLDLRLRLPDGLGALEAPLRKRLSEVIGRGSISLSLRVTRDHGAHGLTDPAKLAAALAQVAQVRAAAEAQGIACMPVDPVAVLSLRGVSEAGEVAAMPAPEVLLADAEPLIAAFTDMRHDEGRALAALLSGQIDGIAELIEAAQKAAAARAEPQAARLRAAIAMLVEATEIDEARLAQEVAALALKTDVTEEIDRLRAHVAAARALLAQGGAVGRKLDFLMQEFNREANTLCSKSQDAGLTAIGLDLKLAIDQTREQVQNVE